jgi:hypothetical protein
MQKARIHSLKFDRLIDETQYEQEKHTISLIKELIIDNKLLREILFKTLNYVKPDKVRITTNVKTKKVVINDIDKLLERYDSLNKSQTYILHSLIKEEIKVRYRKCLSGDSNNSKDSEILSDLIIKLI